MKDECSQEWLGIDGSTTSSSTEKLHFADKEIRVRSADIRKKGSNWKDNHDEEQSPLPPGIK